MEERGKQTRHRNIAILLLAGILIVGAVFVMSLLELWKAAHDVGASQSFMLPTASLTASFTFVVAVAIFFRLRLGIVRSARWHGNGAGASGKRGLSLVETLITVGILATVGVALLGTLVSSFTLLGRAKLRVLATAVATRQMEILRNMPYASLGTTTGWPSGNISSTQTVSEGTNSFTVKTRVDYIDDPFDGNAQGTIPGKPRDTAPTDYKRAEVTIQWGKNESVQLSSRFAPPGVEADTGTGSLFIHVFGAYSQPIPNADVHITNTALTPHIDIANITDLNGDLQIVGLPPSQGSYHIVVSKPGYSTDQTYPPSAQLPNPMLADVSVNAGDVTPLSFSIDVTSTLSVQTLAQDCSNEALVNFSLQGTTKLMGTNPDTPKYSQTLQTDANGLKNITDLEWDTYTLLLQEPSKDIAGYIPYGPLNILPNTQTTLTLILAPNSANSLLATVRDASTKQTINDAQVRLTKTGFDQTKVTGRGFFTQTDWSGGQGQSDFTDATKYSAQDGNIDGTSTTGQISLSTTSTTPAFTEDFASAANKDASATTARWDGDGILEIAKSGSDYLANGTAQSIKLNPTSGSVMSATLTASEQLHGQTIIYSLSNDGGSTFTQVTPGVELTFPLAGNDLRFRGDLSTSDPSTTPQITQIHIAYTVIAYQPSGNLESSTFDTGSASDFSILSWNPASAPPETGAGALRFQIAANNDKTTWNYIGPDGTSSTYFTASGADVPAILDGNRYIRYRILLGTVDSFYTPVVSNISIGYTSGCTPPGQAFFSGLDAATYTIDVTQPSYQPLTTTAVVNGDTIQSISLTHL